MFGKTTKIRAISRTVLFYLAVIFGLFGLDGLSGCADRALGGEPFEVLARLLGNEHRLPNAPRVIPVEEAYPHGSFASRPPRFSSTSGSSGRCPLRPAQESMQRRTYMTQQLLYTEPIRYPWGYFGARGGEWSSKQRDYYDTYSETIFSRVYR